MPWYDGLDLDTPAFGIAQSAKPRIRVIAGPGAGKPFAMKRRVDRLLEEEGVEPRHLLPVTFTRVAAEDLHRELVSLHVTGANALEGRTLHSLAMTILMRAHVMQAVGRTPRALNEFELQPLLEDLNPTFGNKRERKKRIRRSGPTRCSAKPRSRSAGRLSGRRPGCSPRTACGRFPRGGRR